MSRRKTAMVAIVAFVCGAVAFFQARSTALSNSEAGQSVAQQWLSGASDDVVAMENRFNDQVNGLIGELMSEQKALGSVLEDPCTPDQVVLEYSENVIAAHERLLRRAGGHVVELRSKLPAHNREHLMRLCAETVRGPIQRLEGRGGGMGRGSGGGRGMGGGRGYGYGRGGAGQGFGMRREIRNRLASRLGLDERQMSLLQQEDSDFESEAADLRDALLGERQRLLAMFEDSGAAGDQLLAQIDRLIAAHSRIERRVVQHVLVLRPYLTVEQQKWLIGLCRRSQDTPQGVGSMQ